DTLVRYASQKFGTSSFYFTPESNSRYKGVIKTSDGKVSTASLPAAFPEGYVMHLTDSIPGHIGIAVMASGKYANLPVNLIVHTRKKINLAKSAQLENGKALFDVDKNILRDGICSITIFDEASRPVCERLYFKRPIHKLAPSVKTDENAYSKRKKVTLDLSLGWPGHTAPPSVSIAVYRTDSLQEVDENNIVSYLYLTSELQGNVESPGYYFQNNDSAEIQDATENLMLTQGWRRFKWEEVLQKTSKAFEFAPELEGHIITGKVINKSTGEPVPDVTTFLSVPSRHFQIASAVSDESGNLKFDIKNFFGTEEIAVQTANATDTGYRIELANPFSELPPIAALPPFDYPILQSHALLTRSIATQVRNVFNADSLRAFYANSSFDTTAFFGVPDQKYFLDDYTRFNTMEEVMREYIGNILVRRSEGHFRYRVLNYPYKLFFEDDALVLMDGVPVSNIDKIIAFDPLKVQKIELMNRKCFLGPYVADGIISYRTYTGDLAGFQLDPNVLILKYDGLQLQREFYSPKYETEEQVNSREPDFRNLLYWSPVVSFSTTGNARLSFYTSDVGGKYAVVVQGLTSDGQPFAGTETFNVGNP
ncbi:MAG TPA: hypothetical protein VKR32_03080, partial [Puia sp.]|nr:hypothetical protein [Puia sp.]